jgi:sialic acid synthase SpsE
MQYTVEEVKQMQDQLAKINSQITQIEGIRSFYGAKAENILLEFGVANVEELEALVTKWYGKC